LFGAHGRARRKIFRLSGIACSLAFQSAVAIDSLVCTPSSQLSSRSAGNRNTVSHGSSSRSSSLSWSPQWFFRESKLQHFFRLLVITPSEKCCSAQLLVFRPFRISYFAHEHWLSPQQAAHPCRVAFPPGRPRMDLIAIGKRLDRSTKRAKAWPRGIAQLTSERKAFHGLLPVHEC
jgi:hypothetical protein